MRNTFLQFTCNVHILREVAEKTSTAEPLTVSEKPLPQKVEWFQLEDEGRLAAADTVHQVLERLGPLSYLENEYTHGLIYKISRFKDVKPTFKEKKLEPPDHGKEIHFNTICTKRTVRHNLRNAYKILSNGSRVEFHLRGDNVQTIDWALKNALHVRPDIINAAMPEGTEQLLAPIQLGNDLIWVLEHKKNRTRALTIKRLRRPIPNYTQLTVALEYEENNGKKGLDQEKAYLTVYPSWKEVKKDTELKMQAQLKWPEAEASKYFPPEVGKSALQTNRQELEDQGIRDDALFAEERRNDADPNFRELADPENSDNTNPMAFSRFHMLSRREHVQAKNDANMEEPTIPNRESCDEFTPTIIRYHPSGKQSKKQRIRRSQLQKSRKIAAALMPKKISAGDNLDLEATISPIPERLRDVQVEPAQKDIPADHYVGIESSTVSTPESSPNATSNLQRKHYTVGRYYAKILKPEEPLDSFVRRTWKSP